MAGTPANVYRSKKGGENSEKQNSENINNSRMMQYMCYILLQLIYYIFPFT